MRLKERYTGVIRWFSENVPQADTELHYGSGYELLVAVILSAQCTDKRVNIVTPPLFERFADARSMAASSPEEIYQYIKSVSYPNNKARNMHGMAVALTEKFGGVIPSDPEVMQQLPGVGRKTANVVASVLYGKQVMPVDTHVFRVSDRIGLTTGARTPLQTEMQLTANIPGELLPRAHHWLILHGRYVCTARKPKCEQCGLTDWCRNYQKRTKDNKQAEA